MLIDTHCHINVMVKKTFDTILEPPDFIAAEVIVTEALQKNVVHIINVGTSLIESKNCLTLAQKNSSCSATIGIHPNDLTDTWKSDLAELETLLKSAENRRHIVGIGECGTDKHYPGYSMQRQKDAFCAQIELALLHNLALVVHTRDSGEETLECLTRYKNEPLRGTIHCFSEDLSFAQEAITLGFVLGIGGTITYPKNTTLRAVVSSVGLDHLVLETDAPYLPPQSHRGTKNAPAHIPLIANALATILRTSVEDVAEKTTRNACTVFKISL